MEESILKKLLVEKNYISNEDLERAKDYQKQHYGTLRDYLITSGLITKDLLGQATAEFHKIPYADLNTRIPDKEQVLLIPEDVALKYRVVVFEKKAGELVITTDSPTADGLLPTLQKIFPNERITLAYSLPEDIDAMAVHYRKPLQTRFTKIFEQKKRIASEAFHEIIKDAVALQASDVHFEPRQDTVMIRFRVDGVLVEAGTMPLDYYDNILNRIKVLAGMRTDEHTAAQDGAIRYILDAVAIDMRVSVAPILDGEKTSIRLLAQYVRAFTLADLGLSQSHEDLLQAAAKKPFGMVLVTGPTGSGKTTTLYALIKYINRSDINITTIEDPVEYRVGGINQIQVNPRTNLTFAEGLKSIVRQDPDVILVGEIRDTQTAEIAVNAALTGHLLFSTLHANDAATAIPRLLDMNVEPFLISSTVELIIAQRLVRKICEHCRMSMPCTMSKFAKFPPSIKKECKNMKTLYRGKGCGVCNNTGYKGRTAPFECIVITSEMRELILSNPSSIQVRSLARKQGYRSLFQDGLAKVNQGITTLEEVTRVTAAET